MLIIDFLSRYLRSCHHVEKYYDFTNFRFFVLMFVTSSLGDPQLIADSFSAVKSRASIRRCRRLRFQCSRDNLIFQRQICELRQCSNSPKRVRIATSFRAGCCACRTNISHSPQGRQAANAYGIQGHEYELDI